MKTFCKECGKQVPRTSEFCCDGCASRFYKRKKKDGIYAEPLFKDVRKLDKYNKEHGTNYSYGWAKFKGII